MNIELLHDFDKFKYPIVRIYLDEYKGKEIKIKKLNELINNNFNNLLLFAKIFFSSNEDLSKINKSLKERKLEFLNNSFFQDKKEDDYIERTFISCINKNVINKLNNVILEKDFSIEPELYMDIYYFDNNKNILINPYDDRGIDFIFLKLDDDILDNFLIKIKTKYEYDLFLKN